MDARNSSYCRLLFLSINVRCMDFSYQQLPANTSANDLYVEIQIYVYEVYIIIEFTDGMCQYVWSKMSVQL